MIRCLNNLGFLRFLVAFFLALRGIFLGGSIQLFKIIHRNIFLPLLVLKFGVIYEFPVDLLLFLWLWLLLHLRRLWKLDIPCLLLFKLLLHHLLLVLLGNCFRWGLLLVNLAKSWKLFFVGSLLKDRASLDRQTLTFFKLIRSLTPAICRKITWLHRLLLYTCLKALTLTETNFFITILTSESYV